MYYSCADKQLGRQLVERLKSQGGRIVLGHFMTSELYTPEPKRLVQFNEAMQVNTLPAYEEEESEPEIDEDEIDRYITHGIT
jgi:hypothetical protein